ncbi:MAG TPA: glycoside hydrolase family 3 N-terminal domain-containing protein [Longimicrobiaceae bacterium]|nr:glycoside hydrolase family 3 N-terminal domain-containing protein [Longimicrobiaceae bacterium]
MTSLGAHNLSRPARGSALPATPHPLARLLLPALRWSDRGYEDARDTIEHGLALGVGGFILFGGEANAVRELTAELHERALHPLLIASDLERGAGQQFRGATPLPPAAALGSLAEPEITRRAAELTAREARALGVNWIYAPVADVDLEPRNPIIGTRAFGRVAERVAVQVAAWVRGCAEGGALSCAKHFPGHGRTVGDSHIERPCAEFPRQDLEADLLPFRSAIQAGTDAMMTAHVCYPALDPDGLPATLSSRILGDLLRDELGFRGLVVTDALIMEGFIEDTDEAQAAVRAVTAGCDALLYPEDTDAVVRELEAALDDGRLSPERADEAIRRIAAAAERVAGGPVGAWGREEDRRWALEIALRSVRVLRGTPALPQGPVRLVEIDDDIGGPFPPYPRDALPAALHAAGVDVRQEGAPLVVLYSDVRAWKGRPGISAGARERVGVVTASSPETTILLFGPPRLAEELAEARHILVAWGGEALMQEAAMAWLAGEHGGLPSAAEGLDR